MAGEGRGRDQRGNWRGGEEPGSLPIVGAPSRILARLLDFLAESRVDFFSLGAWGAWGEEAEV
jgi:hypothetical protein